MAVDVTTKRDNMIENTVYNVRQLLTAIDALNQNASELPQCGTINDDDTFLERDSIKHVNGYTLKSMLGSVLDQFNGIINNSNTFYKNVLYDMK